MYQQQLSIRTMNINESINSQFKPFILFSEILPFSGCFKIQSPSSEFSSMRWVFSNLFVFLSYIIDQIIGMKPTSNK